MMKKIILISASLLVLIACASNDYTMKYKSECSFDMEGDQPLTFYVNGNIATLSGVVCDGSPDAFTDMMDENPNITDLLFKSIDGSADDEANIELAYMVREAKLNSQIRHNGHIASGGTDLFLAGVKRSVEEGAKIGVHSWAGSDGMQGDELPRNHSEHQRYLNYYRAMGIDTEFYWYTLRVAPASGMHYMSMSELRQYGFITH
ncbi:alpha/beta hydrolase [Vibrio panuliri]|uniref:Alpha/beta hydrolase n=2 Tax=Vibrio panuliri TaxID=1381081 RepID=A0A1Q9HFI5_9VIBR|nr:alpha/beta hydrolase [Vibrio panuliri]